jgi:two-component system C4-dicarboxylate transport response regulator DctD
MRLSARATVPEEAIRPPAELLRLHRHSLINLLVLRGAAAERAHVANAFHRESPLRLGPFVTIRCDRDEPRLRAALEGSLSGVERDPTGNPLRASEGGTLFLDAVEGLPLDTQRLLLGFLSRQSAASTAGEAPAWAGRLAVGAATDLAREVESGRFLPALYDCIDKIRVELGPAPDGEAA